VAQSPFHGVSQLPQRFPILHRHLYNKCALIPLPPIACRATSQPITVMIDLYERRTAAFTATGHPFIEARNRPSLADETCPSRIESQIVLSEIVSHAGYETWQ
jgi:hypothetical protein